MNKNLKSFSFGYGFDEYQTQACETAVYPEKDSGSIMALVYTALGLSEAGEVQGKVKKIIRDNSGIITQEHRDAIASELGDVLWYVASCANEIGYRLEEIAEKNIDKLKDRAERGVLGGSGDNR